MATARLSKIVVLLAGLISLALVAGEKASAQDYGGELTYAETRSVSQFNPYQRSYPNPVSDRLYTLIYNTLVSYNYTQERVVPELAADWSTSSSQGDGQAPDQITFTIRDDVSWHDGERFTAADVKFTYQYIERSASNESAIERFVPLVESANVNRTEGTITFNLEKPTPNPAQKFSSLWVIPEHKFDDRYLPKGESDLGRGLVGTGPYKFVEREDMEQRATVELTAFDDYWDGRPYIGTTRLNRYLDPNTMVQAAKFGEVKLIVETPENSIGELEGTGKFRLKPYESLSFHAFAYDNTDPILGRTKVRRALTRAVDRKNLLNNYYAGKGEVLGGPIVPTHPLHNPDVEPRTHSLEKARQLLDEAGCVDRDGDGMRETEEGQDLSFRFTTIKPKAAAKSTNQLVAAAYQDQLEKIGVKIEIQNLTDAEYSEQVMKERNFDIAWMKWEFDPSYNIASLFLSDDPRGDNVVNYSNEDVDKLLRKFRSSDDPDARRNYMYQVQEIIHKESPYTFLYTLRNTAAVENSVILSTGGEGPPSAIDPYYFFSYYDNWFITTD